MKTASWICAPIDTGSAALSFETSFSVDGKIARALLRTSAIGVYQVFLNGKKISDRVLAPGYTSYLSRVQYATDDVTELLSDSNELSISVGPGWAVGRIGYDKGRSVYSKQVLAIGELELTMEDGSTRTVSTSPTWKVYTTPVTFSDIYDGETIDLTAPRTCLGNAELSATEFPLIEQEGADITEHEQLAPVELIVTPKGERVLDFGQNMTGYVSLSIKGNKGDRVVLSHAEVLDKDGNFYTENYRTAKNILTFVLNGEQNTFKPSYSFQGFRYVRIDEFPDQPINPDDFRAIAVHSDLTRTGRFACGDAKINQLYHNIIWGQKSNYLDIPTDCPQRDERLGWTGDTQVFCRTAGINYDTRKFFKKWLGDLRAEQGPNGEIRGVCPERFQFYGGTRISAGWGDVCTIVPYTMYEMFGDKTFLSENLDMMKNWVNYLRSVGPDEYLWLGGYHYGDWLAMDAGEDSYVGATSNDLIASAFYAHSADLLVRAGEAIGEDMSEYRTLHQNVVKRFREYFMENGMPKEEFPLTEVVQPGKKPVDSVRKGITQTAIVLILHFNLCLPEERKALTDKLVELIDGFGGRMSTGFLGTPYILHALTENGRADVAYRLFFQEQNPSWLYSVNHGATTMWEHWNSLKEDGSFWSTAMNSFNHYAYGAVADWMYGTVCGVQIAEPGYQKIRLAPIPCRRLGFAKCAIDTVSGRVESHWYYTEGRIVFEFTIPNGVSAEICLPDGRSYTVNGGSYCYSVKN